MFDDSKRLDKLEAQVADIIKVNNESVKTRTERFEKIEKKHDDAVTAINKNSEVFAKRFESVEKRVDGLEKTTGDLEAQVKALAKKVQNLEYLVGKMKK